MAPVSRVNAVAAHVTESASATKSQSFTANNDVAAAAPQSDDDVVICASVRTPLCKAKKGSFRNTMPEDMMSALYQAIIQKTKVDPKIIEDATIGNVLQPGAGAIQARQAQFMAGLPDSLAVNVVNRQCSSGLQAIANVAGAIKTGAIEVGIAGGVESMTLFDMTSSIDPEKISPAVFENQGAQNCLIPMGITSENVAEKFGIPKDKQDAMAVASHQKAARAQKDGLYDEEIVAVKTRVVDADGNEEEVTASKDEGIRENISVEALGKLKPAFKKGGTTTAGNSSQVTDGAAMCLMASRKAAKKHGLPIIGRFRAFTACGCDPEVMGIGPAVAIPKVLQIAGLKMDDVDIFEINEAFASQATYCVEKLGVPVEKLNPKGGAIALGHPLGCTGARQLATLMPELKRQNKKIGVISMCIGTGMGAAGVFERE